MRFVSLPALGGLILLLVGLGLGLGGLGLIIYSARMTREAIGRRVELVRGKITAVRVRAPSAQMTVIRDEAHGLSVREQSEAIRLFGRLKVPAVRAMQALRTSRLAAVLVLALLAYFASAQSALFAGSRPLHLIVSAGFGIIGWFLPLLVIRRGIKRRTKNVVDGLPDALELLVICVEAGLSFEDGVDRIIGVLQRSQPVLAEELALTSADLKILPSRDRALMNFAERIEAPSVRSVVTTLSQTMRYGTPLAQALRVVASELRSESLMKLEERANQLPTLMTIPMMVFIMPTIFLVVAGPAVLRLLDSFHP